MSHLGTEVVWVQVMEGNPLYGDSLIMRDGYMHIPFDVLNALIVYENDSRERLPVCNRYVRSAYSWRPMRFWPLLNAYNETILDVIQEHNPCMSRLQCMMKYDVIYYNIKLQKPPRDDFVYLQSWNEVRDAYEDVMDREKAQRNLHLLWVKSVLEESCRYCSFLE